MSLSQKALWEVREKFYQTNFSRKEDAFVKLVAKVVLNYNVIDEDDFA